MKQLKTEGPVLPLSVLFIIFHTFYTLNEAIMKLIDIKEILKL